MVISMIRTIRKIYIAITMIFLAVIISNANALIRTSYPSESGPEVLTVIPPCTGSIDFTIEPNSISPNGGVSFIASGLSGCSGKTVKFVDSIDPSFVLSPKATCPSSSTGCTAAFTAPSSENTYSYYATIDRDGNGIYGTGEISPQRTLEVKTCYSTPPPKEIPLGNGCKISLEPSGLDIDDQYNDGGTGRWKNSNIDNDKRIITTTFDDRPSGNCDGDLTFTNSWNTGVISPGWMSITSIRTWKRGCFLGCPNDLAYGFRLSIIDDANTECSVIQRISSCLDPSLQYACPIAGVNVKSTAALVKDTAEFQTHEFVVGECLSNDLGETSTECINLYGASKTKCNTNTNMCTTGIGTCTNPKDIGALNSYNDQVSGSTSSLSSLVPDYIFKLAVNQRGYLITTMDGPGTTCHWDFWVNSPSLCENTDRLNSIASSGADIKCDDSGTGYSLTGDK